MMYVDRSREREKESGGVIKSVEDIKPGLKKSGRRGGGRGG